MNVLVLGASGGTGKWLVKDALAMGHVVTGFMRREPSESESVADCRIVVGNVLDPKSVQTAMVGQDAVFWSVGARAGEAASDLCSTGTTNVLWAMQRAGAQWLVCESAFGVGDSRWGGPYARLLRIVLRTRVLDKERQEQRIRESGVEWVIVRPTILTNGPRTGAYRVGAELRVGWFPRISRADVSDFMLRQLTDQTYLRQAVGITR